MSAGAPAEIAEYEVQLDKIAGALEADPENEELLTLKKEIQDLIALTRARLPQVDATSTTIPTSDRKRKFEAPENRKVGDQVLAKWITGDHQFYPARITSITGNQADPIYTIKFTEYNEIQTLHGHQLRNATEFKKKVMDSSTHPRPTKSVVPPPPPPSSNSTDQHVIGIDTNPSTQMKKKKPSTLKEDLAHSATSWNAFAKTGPKTTKKVGKRKAIGESSMFRVEEGGRLGVIGSGRGMTSDPVKRGRHVFQANGSH